MSQSQGPLEEERVTRIDAAHPIHSKEPLEPVREPRDLARIAAGEVPAYLGEQIHTQASQLAHHLRAKQRQIDHREALLNARIAQFQREVRTSRLWCTERERVAVEREQVLERDVAELQQEVTAISASETAAEATLDKHRDALRQRQAALEARENRLRAGQLQVAREAESLRVAIERLALDRAKHERDVTVAEQQFAHRRSQFTLQRQRLLNNLARHGDSLDRRQQRLDQGHKELCSRSELQITAAQNKEFESLVAASSLLDEQSRILQHDREEFEAERDAAREDLRREREVFEERKREMEQSFAQLRDKLTTRQATLQHRRELVEQMKQQILETHRRTIEMRMIAEQLWQHAAKGKPIAELTRALGSLRAQLVNGFRPSEDELTEKEQQLRKLAGNLNERQLRLKQHRAELTQWLERRNAEIEEQAARLVARELELDAQQQASRDREKAWRAERSEWQARLRQLASSTSPAAA